MFDRIDSIKVKPDWAMARVGGVAFPKALAQFETWGYNNGADGRADTPDDVDLGLVDAQWSMEEFAATYDDDDIKFVGRHGRRGRDGSRRTSTVRIRPASASRNNIGDVWVVARYATEAAGDKPAATLACAGAPAGHRAAVHALRSVRRPA